MTEEIRNKILNTISEIQSLDIQECLSKTLPSNQSLEDRKVWVFNGITIVPVIERAVKQMEAFLSGGEYVFYMENFPTHARIDGFFFNLLNAIKTVNLSSISTNLQEIISYQIYLGIWDRGNVNIFDVNEIDVAKKKSELSTLISRMNKAKKDLEIRLTEIDNELAAKKSEFAAITANKTSSDNELKQIRDALSNANKDIQKQRNDFTFLYAQAEQQKGSLTEFLGEAKKAQDSVSAQIKSTQEDLESVRLAISAIEKQKAEFEVYKKEAEEQVALISSAGLSGAFKRRANLMWVNVGVWFLAIIVGLLGSGYWLWFAFTQLPNFIENGVAIDAISSLLFVTTSFAKIFPVYLGMSFVFKQYTRERKTQEAYEFKAAVSATIKSYSDQLVAEKYALTINDFNKGGQIDKAAWEKYVDARDNYRRELIRTTVLNLYKDIEIEDGGADSFFKNMSKKEIQTVLELFLKNSKV